MGRDKDRLIEAEDNWRAHADRCLACNAPVEDAGEELCQHCRHVFDKDD